MPPGAVLYHGLSYPGAVNGAEAPPGAIGRAGEGTGTAAEGPSVPGSGTQAGCTSGFGI